MERLQERAAPPAREGLSAPDAQRLLAVIGGVLRELRGGDVPSPALDDDLERTLGVDSLARMELMLRLEREFGVRMPEAQVQDARTPADLLRAVAAAGAPAGAAEAGVTATVTVPAAAPAVSVELPDAAATLLDVLHWRAEHAPDRPHITLLADGPTREVLTHAALLERGRAVAAGLQRQGVAPGDSVALMLPTGAEFFESFTGILLAGAVPVPIYPPHRPDQVEDHLRRQTRILEAAAAVLLVSDARALAAARVLRAAVAGLRAVVTVGQLRAAPGDAPVPSRTPQDLALLQFTSGSTGQPKGVMLTHANLLADIRAMGAALDAGARDVFVSWLPLYHDLGLIGAWMGSLYFGVRLVLMPPQAFLARPSRWLRAIHEHGGTLSGGPNFAYEILATKVPDEELRGIDLSTWRVAFNGAEPVHAGTLERFAARFAPYGFDPRALMPVYGLAENAVGLAFTPLGRGPRVDVIDRQRLHAGGRAVPAAADDPHAMKVVSCGVPLAGHRLRVVDASGGEVPERIEGRVQFRGPAATSGYVRNPEATRALFDGEWLETGDVGYLADGELFLTSRVKDLIIRGGLNVHPYDLEEAVGELPGVRRGCVAVFGAADRAAGTDRIVVVAETRLADGPARAALRERIAELAMSLLGLPADDIVLAPPHAVPKTSSGKIRRAAARERYERGLLGAQGRPVPVQLARLWLEAVAHRLRERARAFAHGVCAAWAWLVLGAAAVAALAVAALPGLPARQRTNRVLARACVRLCGLRVAVEGRAQLPGGPAVIVANHASYADWLVLLSELPAGAAFVAKRELAGQAALRWVLERAGTRFVTRDDVHGGVEDTKELTQAAREGRTLVFFPEGTFTRAPGLRPFHMGAFVVAAAAALPVVPASLQGTRAVLPEGSWRPRRHPVRLRIDPPLRVQGRDWQAALQLRDAARRSIASACGEPDMEAGPSPAYAPTLL